MAQGSVDALQKLLISNDNKEKKDTIRPVT